MTFRGPFVAGLAWRAFILLVTSFAFVAALATEGLGAARLLAAALCGWATWALWRYIQRTNHELARYLEAVKLGDLSQSFSQRGGSGFSEVGEALEQGIQRLRDERHRLTDASRFYEAVLDDAPTPLVTVSSDGRIELANKAARRLFVRHQGIRFDDFRIYGETFARTLTEDMIGRPRLVPLMLDAVPQSAMVSAALVHRLGGTVRVVAVQPIQGELNAVEIAAQSDLVRVLTHEIMNSMTPVTSLARSAADLMAEVDDGSDPTVSDARAAVETLARRADGVMHFVESYRQISRTPDVRRKTFAVAPWARELESLFRAGDMAEGVQLILSVTPETLNIEVDPDLMAQVLINLMRNAAEAARDHAAVPRIALSFALIPGNRVQIEVSDNGPGVPESVAQDVFLPFFTTKPKGTGVGLSLARQIVLAHRGSIGLGASESGGALFRIIV
ncbi:PAS domain-containing sensor histidine kinase [Sphingosinicella sp. BN140058]|uniref:sensor histidine kinase n=1 Tax=Sphingosinicella sp. BN140058 TaxID=1892855 RepID=UPI00101034F7|nr:PAS domain-containing sensor histidine kinase [Sphingosinicella sp. BN140058]QAY76827.1 sensor histidine kinase [Sphingosinicella sp. BN140058]